MDNQKIKKMDETYDEFFKECEKKDRCKYLSDIKEQIVSSNMYDHSLIISKNFGENNKRILIVGMEKRGANTAKRNLIITDKLDPARDNRNLHWLATALSIIKFYHPDFSNEEMDKIEIDDDRREELCKPCEYAFTDFFKCGFSKTGKYSQDMIRSREMCSGCVEIFLKELEFIRPQLIIFQGAKLKPIIENEFKDYNKEEILLSDKNECLGLWKYSNNQKTFFVIFMPFPLHRTFENYQWKNIKHNLYECINKATVLV